MAIQEKSLLNTVPGTKPDRSPFSNLGNFRPYTLYTQHFAIFHNNHIYRAFNRFQSTDQFNINDWKQLTINEVMWEDIIGDIKNNQELMDLINSIPADQIVFESSISEPEEITDPFPFQSNNVSDALDELAVRNQDTINTTDEKIKNEADARDQQITDAIKNEADARQDQVDELNNEIEKTNNVLAGVHTTSLIGDTLTRTIGGFTEIQKSLFSNDVVFMAGKTLIFDIYGTVGVYIGDIDQATMNVMTKSISPESALEPTLLGSVQNYEELPLTITEAETLWGRTPRLDDFAHVMTDVNFDGLRVEYYITDLDGQGNITWGNPVPLNTSDFQAQTGAEDAGKVLTGGAVAGTFGNSISIDVDVTENSNNLIKSGSVWSWFGAGLSTLGTNAKNIIGAINELFNNIAEKAVATDDSLLGNGTPTSKLGVRFPTASDLAAGINYALPYKYINGGAVNLNDYRTPGIYTIYNPSSTTNFPVFTNESSTTGSTLAWGTGINASIVLEVHSFVGNTQVKQKIYRLGTNESFERFSTSATAWGAWDDADRKPIGSGYDQKPNDLTPAERRFAGSWVLWNKRAEIYELITEAEYTALFSSVPTYWTSASTIAANQWRVWTPGDINADGVMGSGSSSTGTRRILRSNKAITYQNPLEMNPIDWDDLFKTHGYTIRRASRRAVQTSWTASDLSIGAQVASVTIGGTAYSNMRVVGILTMGGLFPSYAGGNRPPFLSGGVELANVNQPNVPDFSNYDPVNKITANNGEWTATQDGFVRLGAYTSSGNQVIIYYINNIIVSLFRTGTAGASDTEAMYPIKKGDVIKMTIPNPSAWNIDPWTSASNGQWSGCYFIPGLSTGKLSGVTTFQSWRRVS